MWFNVNESNNNTHHRKPPPNHCTIKSSLNPQLLPTRNRVSPRRTLMTILLKPRISDKLPRSPSTPTSGQTWLGCGDLSHQKHSKPSNSNLPPRSQTGERERRKSLSQIGVGCEGGRRGGNCKNVRQD